MIDDSSVPAQRPRIGALDVVRGFALCGIRVEIAAWAWETGLVNPA